MPRRQPVPVLYVMDYYYGPGGGTEGQVWQLLEGLDRRRYAPTLAVFRPTEYTDSAPVFPCPIEVLHVNGLGRPASWRVLSALARRIRRDDVAITHAYFNDASLVSPIVGRLGGARTVVSRRDMGFWYTPSALRWLRATHRFVDLVVSNSEAVRQNVIARERPDPSRVKVVYNGHPPARFEAPPDPGLRSSLAIDATAPIVGMIANLWPRKRHADLVEAFARLAPKHPAAHLVLVGHGEMGPFLKARAEAFGISQAVHIIDHVRDAVPVVQHFAVGVLSSDSEGLSNTVLEYLGCGVPAVCTNVGGNPELVSDGECGFLVTPGDIGELARRIDMLLSDPGLARRLGDCGRARVCERFTTARMVDTHMTLYDELLGQSRGD